MVAIVGVVFNGMPRLRLNTASQIEYGVSIGVHVDARLSQMQYREKSTLRQDFLRVPGCRNRDRSFRTKPERDCRRKKHTKHKMAMLGPNIITSDPSAS